MTKNRAPTWHEDYWQPIPAYQIANILPEARSSRGVWTRVVAWFAKLKGL